MPGLKKITIQTNGFNDVINITALVESEVKKSDIKEGTCLVFVAHSTCAISVIEYEEGVIEDLKMALNKMAPINDNYKHNKAWSDGNGFSHVRASLMKPDLMIPIENGKLVLGQWQQVVLIDFDNRSREREIIIKIM